MIQLQKLFKGNNSGCKIIDNEFNNPSINLRIDNYLSLQNSDLKAFQEQHEPQLLTISLQKN
ncbi:unnamed protein product [Paramecium octaurelia]|uniref:Uncharacterized protein n=1 Tax=Paramecium octaurelia TaxID=43137 RepID=A0A8S1XCX5_PAROT|nr:unnamed protein product [Paramecium octaurelia]